jgi:hypothetical protein
MLPVKAAWCCRHVVGFRYADDMRRLVASRSMRVLVVEDEPYPAEVIRDGLRLEVIAADIVPPCASLSRHCASASALARLCDGKIKIGVWMRFVFQCVVPPLAIV